MSFVTADLKVQKARVIIIKMRFPKAKVWKGSNWRSIVVGVTGFKLTILMCSLIR